MVPLGPDLSEARLICLTVSQHRSATGNPSPDRADAKNLLTNTGWQGERFATLAFAFRRSFALSRAQVVFKEVLDQRHITLGICLISLNMVHSGQHQRQT